MFKNQIPNGCIYSGLFIYPNPENISNKKVLAEKDIYLQFIYYLTGISSENRGYSDS
ncbi:hypothetical protein [Chryseobacterium sp. IT-36CA2]|uniref:hypothetical protein n=1 Tax=Chryseobacterium sp. IT-36CA2 TaxID=3026460 RepID=UPI0039DF9ED9